MSTGDFSGQVTHSSFSANPLTRKLLNFASLSIEDCQALNGLVNNSKTIHKAKVIAEEGEFPNAIFLITSGVASRSRALIDGSCQILTFMIPGDICDLDVFLLNGRDHAICALNEIQVTLISREAISHLLLNHPQIALALRRSAMQEQAMLRERIVALGRRDARGRLSYLLCELLWRYEAIGLTKEMFRLPLTQTELGDSLGLTQVHVNRVLRELKDEGLISVEHRKVVLLDITRIKEAAGINQDYLNFAKASAFQSEQRSPYVSII